MSAFRRRVIRAVVVLVGCAGLVGGVNAAAAPGVAAPVERTAADPDAPVPLGRALQFGGGYASISYDNLWDADKLSALWVDTSKPVKVTAYFAAWPKFDAQGQPSPKKATLQYRWAWACGAAPLAYLSSTQSTTLEPAPGTTMFNYFQLDALKLDATLTPGQCSSGGRFVVEFNTVESTGSAQAMNSPTVRALPSPFGTPGSTILGSTEAYITLYKIGTPAEVAEVQKTGLLKNIPSDGFRYFVQDCKAAQDLVGWFAGTNDPAGHGLFKFSVPRQAVQESLAKVAGYVGKSNGRPDIVGVVAEKGVHTAFNDPTAFTVIKDAVTCI
ncbi:hypothetical protein OG394_33840 [Kribbella sp. NBC_01245]|uniref:hypothetical protein n=1 Tax=Kribbella sp. NBC_01245 TaxID=2903578 RepID=UPI002E27F11A|nr:hypothetical protein [Kribbella sp. NBC_01245]